MDYAEFRSILKGAIDVLVQQNEDHKARFNVSMLTLSKVSEIEIDEFEKLANVKLPEYYREFIKEQLK